MAGLPYVLTQVAREAVLAERGDLYSAILEAARTANPAFQDDHALRSAVKSLLGPGSVREILLGERTIKGLVTAVRVAGKHVQILESHPILLLRYAVYLGAMRVALARNFGGLEGYEQLIAQHVAEGGNREELESEILRPFQERLQEILDGSVANP